MVRLDLGRLFALTPQARPAYRQAFDAADSVLAAFEIRTARRVAHFLAQILHESGGFLVLVENLSYSPERLLAVWPSRFPTLAAALPYARNPRALAQKVYGGRLGNLNAEDGWTFRGRGFLQITGRENYTRVSGPLNVDFAVAPDKVLLPGHSLSVAACLWQLRRANEAADTDDLEDVTRAVNGGLIGLESRRSWLDRVRPLVEEVDR